MTEHEKAIEKLKELKTAGSNLVPSCGERAYVMVEALEMAIKALERQIQTQRAIEALHEMSAKYAEMYLDTAPDTDEHILDRIRYRAAADIYANAANMVKVLLRVGENDD